MLITARASPYAKRPLRSAEQRFSARVRGNPSSWNSQPQEGMDETGGGGHPTSGYTSTFLIVTRYATQTLLPLLPLQLHRHGWATCSCHPLPLSLPPNRG
ncbi:unnamed protein product [Ectocarpus sp. 4 AP-2014]